MAILEELICLRLVSGENSEKLEAATLKLGSIEIEDNLTEESLEAPWWTKLKKKHGDMTEEEEEEGSTAEPMYSTFSWVDETPDETSTTTRPSSSPTSPPSSSEPSKPDFSSAMTETTTKGKD